jgi:hypothetical protein
VLQQLSIKFWDFEESLATLLKWMDEMEAKIQQLKAMVFLQHYASTSINHGLVFPSDGNTISDNEDHGTTPMDIEESPFSRPGHRKFKTRHPLISKCSLRFCGFLVSL